MSIAAFDAAATVLAFGGLPPGRRVLTFTVSALPAAIGSWLLRASPRPPS